MSTATVQVLSRLEVLQTSLQKKKAALEAMFDKHFADVKGANCVSG